MNWKFRVMETKQRVNVSMNKYLSRLLVHARQVNPNVHYSKVWWYLNKAEYIQPLKLEPHNYHNEPHNKHNNMVLMMKSRPLNQKQKRLPVGKLNLETCSTYLIDIKGV